MQYINALEGLRSQGCPIQEVTIRQHKIMQRFIEGVRNLELKRNIALMYAPEQYVEAPPTVEALRFTVKQYLRMHGSFRPDNYPIACQQHQQPAQANHQNQALAAPPPAPNMPQPPPTASGLSTTAPESVFQLR